MEKNYVYMSEDGLFSRIDNCDAAGNKLVYFKVGYSKHPKYRGYQINSESKNKFNINYHFAIDQHIVELPNAETARKVEQYVLAQVARIGKCIDGSEYFRLTIAQREWCYKMLPIWTQRALRNK